MASKREAGIPNIQGSISDMPAGSKMQKNGAFVGSDMPKYIWRVEYDSNAGNVGFMFPFNFDASNSNSIYGGSDTVQPPAIQAVAQIKF